MRGYVLAEASLCVAIAATAALPLALLAITGLDTARRQRAMFDVARVTAEAAERWRAQVIGHAHGGDVHRGDAHRGDAHRGDVHLAHCEALHDDASCAPGERLVVGTSSAVVGTSSATSATSVTSAASATGNAALPRVALWMAP